MGFALGYLAGWMIPGALFFGWLWQHGAWRAFLENNFTKGPSSKGSLVDVLMRPIRQTLGDPWLTQECAAAIILGTVVFLILRRSPSVTRAGARLASVVLVAAAMATHDCRRLFPFREVLCKPVVTDSEDLALCLHYVRTRMSGFLCVALPAGQVERAGWADVASERY